MQSGVEQVKEVIEDQVRFNIDGKFREGGITIPFPQRDVHFFQQAIPQPPQKKDGK